MCGSGLNGLMLLMWVVGLLFSILALLVFGGLVLVLACWLHPWSWLLLGVCLGKTASRFKFYSPSLLVFTGVLAFMAVCSSPYGFLFIGLLCLFEKPIRSTFTKQYGSERSIILYKTELLLVGGASRELLHLMLNSDQGATVRGFVMLALGCFAFGASSGHVGEALEISCNCISFLSGLLSLLKSSSAPPTISSAAKPKDATPQRTGVCRVITVDATVGADLKSWHITGTNLSCETVASFRASREVTLGELQTTFASRLGACYDEVKLILPDARCLTGLKGGRRLASVIDTLGMTLKSKRAKQRQKVAKH
jgi:hypothetical protein